MWWTAGRGAEGQREGTLQISTSSQTGLQVGSLCLPGLGPRGRGSAGRPFQSNHSALDFPRSPEGLSFLQPPLCRVLGEAACSPSPLLPVP